MILSSSEDILNMFVRSVVDIDDQTNSIATGLVVADKEFFLGRKSQTFFKIILNTCS